MFYKIKKLQLPEYLYSLIPSNHHHNNTRNLDFLETDYCRNDAFKYLFFPYKFQNGINLIQSCSVPSSIQYLLNRY